MKPLAKPALFRSVLLASLLAALALVLVFPARRSVFVQDAERWGFDSLVTKSHAQFSSNVVIIDFDDEAQAALKGDQIPRTAIAEVIRKIAAGKPAAIGLDFLLTERRNPEGDKALADAIHDAGNVVVASQSSSSTAAGGGAISPSFALPTNRPYLTVNLERRWPPGSSIFPWMKTALSGGAMYCLRRGRQAFHSPSFSAASSYSRL